MAALSFPLELSEFSDLLDIQVLSFDLGENMSHSTTGGGEVLTADLGPRLWGGTLQVNARPHAVQRQIEPLASALRQAGRSFRFSDPRAQYPFADPDGSILAASTPTIHTLDADNRRLRITGLPVGYILTAGDQLTFSYGSPARTALHRVLVGGTASASGLTPLIEVEPFIRPGVVTTTAVTLVKPYCKAVVVPGTFRTGDARRARSGGFSFQFQQTLR